MAHMALAVADHRGLLNRILADHGLSADTLELVPDVQRWCPANETEESNPFAQAKCLCRSDGACHIVMVDVLTEDAINGGKGRMDALGLMHEVAGLDTEVKYLTHLMLHEVACHVLGTTEQLPRDKWAFDRLNRYAG
jgi:hypothetical protein